MGTDVHGYVEVNGVGLTGERNYDIFGLLFGVRGETEMCGIAKNRGIPGGTSNEQYLNNKGLHGQTWIYWEEIVKVSHELPRLRGWNIIFSVMELLFEQYGKNSTRLVVSFDN